MCVLDNVRTAVLGGLRMDRSTLPGPALVVGCVAATRPARNHSTASIPVGRDRAKCRETQASRVE
jgi:hypothetical protein